MRAMRGRNCGANTSAAMASSSLQAIQRCTDQRLQEKFGTRRIGLTGAAEQLDKELEVLHRSVRVVDDELMEIEADQKHVHQLLEDLGLTQSKHCQEPPRVKLSVIEEEPIENSPMLEGDQATTFRSGTMRCAYLAQDRVDSSEAIKCLAQAMSKPKAGHMTQLQRVARYLKGVPRKALQYPSQEPSSAHLEVHVDSDWAGDSNASEEVRSHCAERTIFAQTQLNSTKLWLDISGAESEYYALTKGGCSGLGLQSLFADWNLKLQLSLHKESSSAKALASRWGAGKSTRHMQMPLFCSCWPVVLWRALCTTLGFLINDSADTASQGDSGSISIDSSWWDTFWFLTIGKSVFITGVVLSAFNLSLRTDWFRVDMKARKGGKLPSSHNLTLLVEIPTKKNLVMITQLQPQSLET